ncbi:MAG: hypothetical protein SGI83_15145 [Bacteroidota bacterium]|nr:hypothetical protein [Bacteroidota bacterium]
MQYDLQLKWELIHLYVGSLLHYLFITVYTATHLALKRGFTLRHF